MAGDVHSVCDTCNGGLYGALIWPTVGMLRMFSGSSCRGLWIRHSDVHSYCTGCNVAAAQQGADYLLVHVLDIVLAVSGHKREMVHNGIYKFPESVWLKVIWSAADTVWTLGLPFVRWITPFSQGVVTLVAGLTVSRLVSAYENIGQTKRAVR